MSQHTVVLDLASDHTLARDLVAGGVFVPHVLKLGIDCMLVLRNGDEALELPATCVFVDGGRGSGLELVGCDAEMKQRIIALASGMNLASEPITVSLDDVADDDDDGSEGNDEGSGAVTAADEAGVAAAGDDDSADAAGHTAAAGDDGSATAAGDDDARPDGDGGAARSDDDAYVPGSDDDLTASTEELSPEEAARMGDDDETDEERKLALNMHQRLRGLTLVQQVRRAQKGEVSERIVLERMYGKSVWEALLRNPRITGPEVARIARMGALPRVLMELIVGSGAWLQIPEVRRALLSNPRLGTDQILRVLRLLPKHELKLAGVQTAYSHAVRDAAKRMLRELDR